MSTTYPNVQYMPGTGSSFHNTAIFSTGGLLDSPKPVVCRTGIRICCDPRRWGRAEHSRFLPVFYVCRPRLQNCKSNSFYSVGPASAHALKQFSRARVCRWYQRPAIGSITQRSQIGDVLKLYVNVTLQCVGDICRNFHPPLKLASRRGPSIIETAVTCGGWNDT